MDSKAFRISQATHYVLLNLKFMETKLMEVTAGSPDFNP